MQLPVLVKGVFFGSSQFFVALVGRLAVTVAPVMTTEVKQVIQSILEVEVLVEVQLFTTLRLLNKI